MMINGKQGEVGGEAVTSSNRRTEKESGGGGGDDDDGNGGSGITYDGQLSPNVVRVLIVDDDIWCRESLEKIFQDCKHYEVTPCSSTTDALYMLREGKYKFDIVLTEVHMPNMDGFKLLEHISIEMDQIPVVLMSSDNNEDVVQKGVKGGASAYLIKPIGMQAIQNIWPHIVRKIRNKCKELDQQSAGTSGAFQDDSQRYNQRVVDDDDDAAGCSSSGNERSSLKSSKKKREGDQDDAEDRDNISSHKKPRVVWTARLHQKFLAAVNQLGIDRAVPKKILELMNEPGLTRENVASHLQKHRLQINKQSQSGLNVPSMDRVEANINQVFDRGRPLTVSAQLPLQRNMYIGQSSTFSPEMSSLRFGTTQQQQQQQQQHQQQQSFVNAQENYLLNGLPNSMSALQVNKSSFGHRNYSTRTGLTGHTDDFIHGNHNSSLMLHSMAQSQYTGNVMNGIANTGQQIFSNDQLERQVVVRNIETVLNVRRQAYHPVVPLPQPSHAIDFPTSHHVTELPENYLPFDSTIPSSFSGELYRNNGVMFHNDLIEDSTGINNAETRANSRSNGDQC